MNEAFELLSDITFFDENRGKVICRCSRQFLSDWQYLRMAERDSPAVNDNEDDSCVADSAAVSKSSAVDLNKQQTEPQQEDEETAAMRQLGLPTSFSTGGGMPASGHDFCVVRRSPVDSSTNRTRRPACKNFSKSRDYEAELPDDSSGNSNASTGSSDSTENSRDGGIHWLRCRGDNDAHQSGSFEWQECHSHSPSSSSPPASPVADESAASAWSQRVAAVENSAAWSTVWYSVGEKKVVAEWMALYGEYVDNSSEQTTGSSAANECATTVGDNNGVSGDDCGDTGPGVDDVSGAADSGDFTEQVSSANDCSNGHSAPASAQNASGDSHAGWAEVWRQHYHSVYQRMLEQFAKKQQQSEQHAAVVDPAAISSTSGDCGAAVKNNSTSKKRRASKRKSLAQQVGVGVLLQQLQSEQCASQDNLTHPDITNYSSTARDSTCSPPTSCVDSVRQSASNSCAPDTSLSNCEADSAPSQDDPSTSHKPSDASEKSHASLQRGAEVLEMLGFCTTHGRATNAALSSVSVSCNNDNNSCDNNGMFAANAAHVVHRQRKLRYKTDALNMTRHAMVSPQGQQQTLSEECIEHSDASDHSRDASHQLGNNENSVNDSACESVCQNHNSKDNCDDDSSDVTTDARDSHVISATTQRRVKRAAAAATDTMPDTVRQRPCLHKYWYQRYRLFSKFDSGIQLDTCGWFSVTPERIAAHIAARCRLHQRPLVLDAFCGCGGNSIQFARANCHVIAVDLDGARLKMAQHNAAIYGVSHLIEFVQADFFQLACSRTLSADCVFLSPPWGGPEYCNAEVYDLYRLDGHMDGRAMFATAASVSRNICLLAPRNVNVEQLTALSGVGGRVEIEQNILNGRIKTVTAYFGDLVTKQ